MAVYAGVNSAKSSKSPCRAEAMWEGPTGDGTEVCSKPGVDRQPCAYRADGYTRLASRTITLQRALCDNRIIGGERKGGGVVSNSDDKA